MASIKDRGNGSFLISVSKGRVNGKQQIVSTTYKPQLFTPSGKARGQKALIGDVEHYAMEFERQVKEGLVNSDNRITVEDFVKVWEDGYGKQRLTQHTLEDYKDILRRSIIPHIGGLKLSSVKVEHVRQIIKKVTDSGKAPATIKKVYVVLNSVFSYAVKMDYITISPCIREKLDLPTVSSVEINMDEKKQEHILSVEQTERFLAFCRKPYEVTVHRKNGTYTQKREIPLQMQAYFHMAFCLGARRGELIALRWTDIAWKTNAVTISKATSMTRAGQIDKTPKTANGYRVLEMTQRCAVMLRKWYNMSREYSMLLGPEWRGSSGRDFDENYVFIKDDGTQMSVWTPYQSLRNAIVQYNKRVPESEQLPEIRLHDARHTNASMQIALGVSLADTSRNLGHGDVATTSRIYVHGQPTSAHSARNALEKALG